MNPVIHIHNVPRVHFYSMYNMTCCPSILCIQVTVCCLGTFYFRACKCSMSRNIKHLSSVLVSCTQTCLGNMFIPVHRSKHFEVNEIAGFGDLCFFDELIWYLPVAYVHELHCMDTGVYIMLTIYRLTFAYPMCWYIQKFLLS